MLIILFGLMGAGKSFIGKILKEEFAFEWLEGDDFLSLKMKKDIEKNKIFSEVTRKNFMSELIDQVSQKKLKTQNLVVTQALYKEKNRQQLLNVFPDAKLIYVLAIRNDIKNRFIHEDLSFRWEYAKKIEDQFEIPQFFSAKIFNYRDKKYIIKQIKPILFG